MRWLCIFIVFFFCLAASQEAAANPPSAKFFPLKRGQQTGNPPPAKFFPLDRKGGMKLTFQPSKPAAIRPQDTKQHEKPLQDKESSTGNVNKDQASQLLSIYPAVD